MGTRNKWPNVCFFYMYVARLRLADILVRPMQRLTKYTLLLTAIRKHITDENDAEAMDAMVTITNLYTYKYIYIF